jgi:glycogen synthase
VRIALLSSEYPPDQGHGGIATYVHQAGLMLASLGHEVEVFASSATRELSTEEQGVLVHRLNPSTKLHFPEAAARLLQERHLARPFDVLEAGEFEAQYMPVARALPELPLLVKLHSPTFIIRRLMNEGWRYDQHGPRRWIWRLQNRWRLGLERAPADDAERHAIGEADLVSAPSRAIARLVRDEWGIADRRVSVLPLPFQAPPSLLGLPQAPGSRRVLFLGRLEVRKGVIDLADAVPHVCRRVPGVQFLFVGADAVAPDGGAMSHYLRRRAGSAAGAMQFLPRLPYERLHEAFAETAVAVFPSTWESFGYVCLEAMAAARPVVVTTGTGLAESMGEGEAGLSVPARSPRRLARAIVSLLEDPDRGARLGKRGRQRVNTLYSWEAIGPRQVWHYEEAVRRHRATGTAHA